MGFLRSIVLLVSLAGLGACAAPGDEGSGDSELGAGPDAGPGQVGYQLTIAIVGSPPELARVSATNSNSGQTSRCADSECTYTLAAGTPLLLEAAPAEEFVEWEPQLGAGCSFFNDTGVSARLSITRNCVIYAYFGEAGPPPPPGP